MEPEQKKTFGEYLRELRLSQNLPLRKVASKLDIDPSTLGKIERNKRKPSHKLIEKVSKIFSVNEKELKTIFLREKICSEIFELGLDEEVLHVAEERMKYIKATKTKQTNLNFD